MILESERRPLLAPYGAARLSLAGAQDKLPLFQRDGRWLRPLGGSPTTHILKPSSAGFPDIVANEFLSMRLAGRLGLGVPRVGLAPGDWERFGWRCHGRTRRVRGSR
ncbi:MAG: hypothetical protein CVV51_00510 [Spirochaetae bacterium HGW-Spirochaetae-7]|nr:MAG: hypothetical protein CVV51_00510 [Spirochaetae bacterium HGW-Spirochaetae-7]